MNVMGSSPLLVIDAELFGRPAKLPGMNAPLFRKPARSFRMSAKSFRKPAKSFSMFAKLFSKPARSLSILAESFSKPAESFSTLARSLSKKDIFSQTTENQSGAQALTPSVLHRLKRFIKDAFKCKRTLKEGMNPSIINYYYQPL